MTAPPAPIPPAPVELWHTNQIVYDWRKNIDSGRYEFSHAQYTRNGEV